MENIEKILKECFAENGIIVKEYDKELEMDSIQYISLIVSIEQMFGIEYPEDMLLDGEFLSYNKIYLDVYRIMQKF